MRKEKKQNWYVNPKKYHFIYKTTCEVNGKYYYGMHSTDDLNDGYVGSGTRLWHSIKKHGQENFKLEILEFCENREVLKRREAELITEEVLKDPSCMNLKIGGEGGFTREATIKSNTSELGLKKCRKGGIASIKKNKDKLVKRLTENNFKRWSSSREEMLTYQRKAIAKAASKESSAKRKETLAKIEHQQGNKNSQFGTCWIFHELVGNKKCKRDLLPEYLEQGWMKGRIT